MISSVLNTNLNGTSRRSERDGSLTGVAVCVQVEFVPAGLMNVGQVSRSAGTASPHVFRARRKCRSPRACWENPGCCLHNKSKPNGSTAARSIQLHISPAGGGAHRSACLDSLSNTRKTHLSARPPSFLNARWSQYYTHICLDQWAIFHGKFGRFSS